MAYRRHAEAVEALMRADIANFWQVWPGILYILYEYTNRAVHVMFTYVYTHIEYAHMYQYVAGMCISGINTHACDMSMSIL